MMDAYGSMGKKPSYNYGAPPCTLSVSLSLSLLRQNQIEVHRLNEPIIWEAPKMNNLNIFHQPF